MNRRDFISNLSVCIAAVSASIAAVALVPAKSAPQPIRSGNVIQRDGKYFMRTVTSEIPVYVGDPVYIELAGVILPFMVIRALVLGPYEGNGMLCVDYQIDPLECAPDLEEGRFYRADFYTWHE